MAVPGHHGEAKAQIQKSDRLVIRCETVTSLPDAAILCLVSFCNPVGGSAPARRPVGVVVISTATLSAAHVAIGSSGAFRHSPN
jgi:hypothetical protein